MKTRLVTQAEKLTIETMGLRQIVRLLEEYTNCTAEYSQLTTIGRMREDVLEAYTNLKIPRTEIDHFHMSSDPVTALRIENYTSDGPGFTGQMTFLLQDDIVRLVHEDVEGPKRLYRMQFVDYPQNVIAARVATQQDVDMIWMAMGPEDHDYYGERGNLPLDQAFLIETENGERWLLMAGGSSTTFCFMPIVHQSGTVAAQWHEFGDEESSSAELSGLVTSAPVGGFVKGNEPMPQGEWVAGYTKRLKSQRLDIECKPMTYRGLHDLPIPMAGYCILWN